MESIYTSAAAPDTAFVTAQAHQQGAIVVELVRSGFGKGEAMVRCLSQSSSGSERCKSTAKTGDLFCNNHLKSGVIASAVLKAAYQISPDVIKPFVVKERLTAGIFENKSAKDASKSKDAAPKQAKKVQRNKCKKTNGQECTTPTRFVDGYCHHHRGQIRQAEEQDNHEHAEQGQHSSLFEQDDEDRMMAEDLFGSIAERTRAKRRMARK